MITDLIALGDNVHTFFLSNDKKYIYYLDSKQLSVYDLKLQSTVQRLERTQNSSIAISRRGTLIGGVYPLNHGKQIEVFLYNIDKTLTERIRIKMDYRFGISLPCFTVDEQFFCFVTADFDVCFMNCMTGKIRIVYSCEPGTVITSVDTDSFGILLSVFSPDNPAKNSRVILFNSDGSLRKEMRFSNYYEQRCFRSVWSTNNSFLILYELQSCKTAIQCIDNDSTHIIVPHYDSIINYSVVDRVQSSTGRKLLVIGGKTLKKKKKKACIVLYSLPTLEQILIREEGSLNNVFFAHSDHTILFTGQGAHMLTADD